MKRLAEVERTLNQMRKVVQAGTRFMKSTAPLLIEISALLVLFHQIAHHE